MPVIKLDYRPRPQFKPFHDTDKRWSCIVAHRRCVKTVASVRQLERAALRCTKPNPRFAYIAPLYKQAKDIAWQYCKDGARPLAQFGAKINESELRVDYPNGGRVRLYGADNPDSLRGIYLDGVVLDEYADMKPSMWTEVIRPALSDRQGWACFIGTPKGRDAFYRVWREAQKDDDWFTLELKASKTGILPPEELAAAQAQMSASEFAREYECSFDEPDVDQFIAADLVDMATTRRPELGSPRVLGVDVARFGNDRTCFLIRAGDSIEVIERKRGLDTMQTAAHAASLIEIHRPQMTFVDGVGVGGGVVDRLRQLGYRVVDVNAGGSPLRADRYTNKRAEMWGVMREWIKDRGCLPDDRELIDDLVAPSYEFDHSNRLKLEKKEDMKERGLASPDSADALALTFAFPVATKDAAAPAATRVVTDRPRSYAGVTVATGRR
jgi:hypothetical protein